MNWQDLLMGISVGLMALAMIPTALRAARTGRTDIPLTTSILTTVCLGAMVVAFGSLGLWYSAFATAATFMCWWMVACVGMWQRR